MDAAQGIEAQTLANVYLALEHDLTIIPVINKIDLPERRAREGRAGDRGRHRHRRGGGASCASAKEGIGVAGDPGGDRRRASRRRSGERDQPLRALIFDSHYDAYKGVIAYVRVVDGALDERRRASCMMRHGRRGRHAGARRLHARA